MSSELPEGWGKSSLSSLATIQSGVGFPVKYQGITDELYPVYKVGDVSRAFLNNKGNLIAAEHYVSGETANEMKGKVFPVGTTLFAKIGEALKLNRRVFVQREGLADNNVMGVIAHLTDSEKYIYRFLQQYDIAALSRSTTVPSIRKSDLEEIELPVPPLNEQIRIANKLDSLLAKVDAAQTRLEKIPTLLKRFRQAVLAAATSGELTREWREESGVKSVDDYVFPFSDIPESWEIKLLSEVSNARLGKMLDKLKNTGEPTRYLGNINVRWFEFDLGDLKEIFVSVSERDELTIENGDVLVCEGGEPGRAAVWVGGENNLVFQKALHRIRLNEEVLPIWLVYCLKNDADRNRLSILFTGTTIKHLTGKALKQYPIPVPPLEEQTQIVRRVESLFTLADTVEKQYLAAKQRLDRLSQSILAKAFRGELVPQDPNDEPASELLKRIQVEREKLKPVKKRSIKKKRVEPKGAAA